MLAVRITSHERWRGAMFPLHPLSWIGRCYLVRERGLGDEAAGETVGVKGTCGWAINNGSLRSVQVRLIKGDCRVSAKVGQF